MVVIKLANYYQKVLYERVISMLVSGKRGGLSAGQVVRFFVTIFILLMFMGASLLGLYIYMDYLVGLNEREGFSEDDLVVPLSEERPIILEDPPRFISPWNTGLSTTLSLVIAVNNTDNVAKLDGVQGVGLVLNLTLKNSGENDLFIERVYAQPEWGGEVTGQLGNYLDVGDEEYMRHLLVPIPDPLPDIVDRKLTILFDILVESGGSWYRREGIFWEYPLVIHEMTNVTSEFEIKTNPAYYFDKVNDLVRTDSLLINSIVENSTLGDGNFTIQKIVDAYEYVRNSLDYIADPDTGENEWITPMTCLAEGGGDCEDFSILLGSVITAMGGNARIIITSGHAFNAVYIGTDDSILDSINDRYGLNIPFQIMEDKLGKWLIIEPQSQLVFGWFPLDVEPVAGEGDLYIYGQPGMSWQFVDSEEVSVVDIYF